MAKKTSQPARRNIRERDLRRVQTLTRQTGDGATATVEPGIRENGDMGSFSGVTFEPKAAQRPITDHQAPAPHAVARPASSGVVAARDVLARNRAATAAANRASRMPTISREQEYSFIRADLRTVLILTILMIIVLAVLWFVLH